MRCDGDGICDLTRLANAYKKQNTDNAEPKRISNVCVCEYDTCAILLKLVVSIFVKTEA